MANFKVTRRFIREWAKEEHWLLVREHGGAGVKAYSRHLVYVTPSGNIINFALNDEDLAQDVYEGRRAGA